MRAFSLGWDRIDCRVVNVSSMVAGEHAENEIRKDFTPMERVTDSVGTDSLETAHGNKNGEREAGDVEGRAAS